MDHVHPSSPARLKDHCRRCSGAIVRGRDGGGLEQNRIFWTWQDQCTHELTLTVDGCWKKEESVSFKDVAPVRYTMLLKLTCPTAKTMWAAQIVLGSWKHRTGRRQRVGNCVREKQGEKSGLNIITIYTMCMWFSENAWKGIFKECRCRHIFTVHCLTQSIEKNSHVEDMKWIYQGHPEFLIEFHREQQQPWSLWHGQLVLDLKWLIQKSKIQALKAMSKLQLHSRRGSGVF